MSNMVITTSLSADYTKIYIRCDRGETVDYYKGFFPVIRHTFSGHKDVLRVITHISYYHNYNLEPILASSQDFKVEAEEYIKDNMITIIDNLAPYLWKCATAIGDHW